MDDVGRVEGPDEETKNAPSVVLFVMEAGIKQIALDETHPRQRELAQHGPVSRAHFLFRKATTAAVVVTAARTF